MAHAQSIHNLVGRTRMSDQEYNNTGMIIIRIRCKIHSVNARVKFQN